MRIAAITVLAALGAGCAGLSAYEKSAARFGASATAGATAARSALAGARESCRMRAWLHAVSDRFERPGFRPGTDPLARSSGVAREGGGELTWREYCAELARQDATVEAALTALEAYASVLKDVASQPAALDTSIAGALAAEVDGMAAVVGGGSTAAQALSGPAGALARAAIGAVRTRRLREAVRAGEAPMNALADGLDAYLDAAALEGQDARSLAIALIREADAVIPVRPAGGPVPPELPGQALALYEFSRLELARLDAADQQLAATRKLVAALRAGHAQLARGAAAASDDPEITRAVAAQVNEVVAQVLALRRLDRRNP